MSKRAYTILLHPDLEDGGYAVTVPALPGCVDQERRWRRRSPWRGRQSPSISKG